MPDIALLTSTAPAAVTPPSHAAPTATPQFKKELLKADPPVVQAAKEDRRGAELCLIMQEWQDRKEEAKRRASLQEKIWLKRIGSLLDFPGASGLDTPFFLFLQHLHFPPDETSGSSDLPDPCRVVKNPLLSALYGPKGPFRPFRTLRVPDYNKQRKERILSLLRDQLKPEFRDMSLRALVSDERFAYYFQWFLDSRVGSVWSYGCLGLEDAFRYLVWLLRLLSVTSRDSPSLVDSLVIYSLTEAVSSHPDAPQTLFQDVLEAQSLQDAAVSSREEVEEKDSDPHLFDAVLGAAARLWLNSPRARRFRNALFFNSKTYTLTEFLPLFPTGKAAPTPKSQHTCRVEPDGAVSSNPTRPSSLHSDFLTLPAAKPGCVSYVHLVGEPVDPHSPEFFWSLFACFDTSSSNLTSSVQQVKQSPACKDFMATLAEEGLALEVLAPSAADSSEELPDWFAEPVLKAGEPIAVIEEAEGEGNTASLETKEQKDLEEQADPPFSLPPLTNLAIHIVDSNIPHHLLTPLNLEAPSSPSDSLVLTVDSKILGNTYKATVFSATTSSGIKLVVKYSQEDNLIEEEKVLRALNRLEPDLTPKCYGIFDGKGAMKGYRALLLEHGGETVTTSFSKLEEEQRQAIFDCLHTAHKAGYTHNSFAKRNVVRDASGRYRLIDFERAGGPRVPW